MELHDLLNTLTLEHATQWTNEREAVTWIEYTLLDPNDLPRSNRNIARIEDRFESLLRQNVESQIADKLIDDALFYGCFVSVNDGEEWTVRASQDKAEIRAAMASTDADLLRFRDADRQTVGDVMLIWGNHHDLISDCSDNEATRALLEGAEALAESLR